MIETNNTLKLLTHKNDTEILDINIRILKR